VKVSAGSVSEIALPGAQVWLAVCAVTVGAPMIVAENVSVAARPLVSVAVTVMPNVWALVGAVPLNVSVAALNFSQLGSAWPFDSLAA
jgi:hypothetical protein